MRDLLKLGLKLFAIAAVAGLALGFTNEVTSGAIEQQKLAESNEARFNVFPDADSFKQMEDPGAAEELFEALDASGNVVGYTGKVTVTGFGGPIEVTVGMGLDTVITGVNVGGTDFAETAGLGAKTKDPEFTGQFKGMTEPVALTKNGGQVEAVTSATISSTAVTNGVEMVAATIKSLITGEEVTAVTAEVEEPVAPAEVTAPTAFTGEDVTAAAKLLPGTVSLAAYETDTDNVIGCCYDETGTSLGLVGRTAVQGFGGPVEITAAMDLEGALTGIAVGGNAFAETPSLGANAKEPAFTDQFIGLKAPIALSADGGQVDAISGATITSTAVVNGVNALAENMADLLGTEPTGEKVTAPAEEPAAEDPAPEEPAAEEAAETEYAALGAALMPAAASFEQIDPADGLDAVCRCYTEAGELTGLIGRITVQGFGGPVEITAGVDLEGALTAIAVGGDTFAETPGLGANAKEPGFTEQFSGLKAPIALAADGGQVDAIASATITSKAVTGGVNSLAESLAALLGVEPAEEAVQAEPAAVPAYDAEDIASGLILMPGAATFEMIDPADDMDAVCRCFDEAGSVLGCIGRITVQGFGGPIEITAGVTPEGTLTGIAVGGDAFAETPGLGANAKEPAFTDQFAGLKAPVALTADGGTVDAIASATITSKAVTGGVEAILTSLTVLMQGGN